MAKGIWFGDVHSHDDLNLILSKVDLPPAAVKTVYVDNPGGDGSLDLTEANGKVNYKDRTAKFTFSVLPEDDFEEKKTEVSNLLNGRRFKITLDKDPDYYWDVRCSVNQYSSNKKMRQIVVGAAVAPYKLKQEKTRVFVPFCGSNLFDCTVLPLIGGSGADISAIDTGVRATWRSGATSYMVVKWLPLEMLIGKEITVSCTITASGGAQGLFRIGYSNANGSARTAAYSLSQTGAKSFVVEKTDPRFEYLAIWFYGNNNGAATEGAYVDYTNIQIELGETATEYEAYTPDSSAKLHNVTLTNGRKTVSPTIICTGEATFNVDGLEFSLSEGTHKVLDFSLEEGETAVTVSGTGAAAIVYQEGAL